MDVHFNLHHPKRSKSAVRLVCRLPVGGPQFRYATGVKLDPAHWDEKTQRPTKKSYSDAKSDTTLLDRLRTGLRNYQSVLALQEKVLDAGLATAWLDVATGRVKRTTALDWVEKYIPRVYTNENTKLSHGQTLNLLNAWEGARGLTWGSVTLEWYQNLLRHCYDTLDHTPNTVGGHVKHVKTWMGEAMDAGLHDNLIFRHKKFAKPSNPTDTFSLTEQEFAAIESVELSAALDRSRDLFMLGKFTGLRYSDYNKVKRDRLVTKTSPAGNEVVGFNVLQQKTRKKLFVPLFPEARKILDKYDGYPPADLPNQNLNENIKAICRKAGLTSKMEVTVYNGDVAKSETKELCDLVGTHTARRSFVTLAIEKGEALVDVSAWVGHHSTRETEKYLTTSQADRVLRMADRQLAKV